MKIITRKATKEDLPLIIQFQQDMARETEGIELSLPVVSAGVAAVFADASRGEYYVAEAGGQVVATMLMTREWSDWRNGQILWFQSVYVMPAFRRKGIFRHMFRAVREYVMHNREISGLRLYVDTSNVRAQEVYRSLGMNGEHYRVFEWMKKG
ncbi:MAG: GNAT family N-acetyltransferase [Bacteroidia bacterium]|nr:GNAT family N-acetyltransferase [Bacteroidia bacterium]